MEETVELQYEDWHAVHDNMGKSLRVDGVCIIPGGGFAVSLEPSEHQGANPQMLMLNLVVTPTAESPTRQTPHYDQGWEAEGIQYTEVGFRAQGATEPPPTLTVEDVY